MPDPLPEPEHPLVGRKKELLDLLRLVVREGVRVVAVTGPAGVGKTRFGLAAAAELAPRVDGEVRLVDGFDRAVHSAASLADALADDPRLRLLVTSREPPGLPGGWVLALRPLPEAPAVELFRQRVRSVAPGLEVDYETAVAMCERVGRLPRAIESAAVELAGTAGR
jgi:predicted ATPase